MKYQGELFTESTVLCFFFFCCHDLLCSHGKSNATENTNNGKDNQHNEDLIESGCNIACGFCIIKPSPNEGRKNGVRQENNEGDKSCGKSSHTCRNPRLPHEAPVGGFHDVGDKSHKESQEYAYGQSFAAEHYSEEAACAQCQHDNEGFPFDGKFIKDPTTEETGQEYDDIAADHAQHGSGGFGETGHTHSVSGQITVPKGPAGISATENDDMIQTPGFLITSTMVYFFPSAASAAPASLSSFLGRKINPRIRKIPVITAPTINMALKPKTVEVAAP